MSNTPWPSAKGKWSSSPGTKSRRTIPMPRLSQRLPPSVHNSADDFDSHPERIQLASSAFAEMIVIEAAFIIVKADEQLFLVFGEKDFQGFSGHGAFLDPGAIRLE